MSDITSNDLKIILQAVYKMAGADLSFEMGEKAFLKKLIGKANIESSEVSALLKSCQQNVLELVELLSSDKARKVCLLSLTAMAFADSQFDHSEKEILDAVTAKLNVGKINLEAMNYEKCVSLILKLIGDCP